MIKTEKGILKKYDEKTETKAIIAEIIKKYVNKYGGRRITPEEFADEVIVIIESWIQSKPEPDSSIEALTEIGELVSFYRFFIGEIPKQ